MITTSLTTGCIMLQCVILRGPWRTQVIKPMAEQDWDTCRTLIKDLLRDPATRKRIEQRTDIAPRTLSRWISDETEEPDRKLLSRLLAALPQYRKDLLAAITRGLPDLNVPLIDPTTRLVEDMPMDFWLRLLETNANTPRNLHFASVVHLIFLQLQSAIDPEHIGVQLIIAQCTPPASPNDPVRSLREVMKMTTHQSLLTSPGDTIFLGAESLSGYSASLCQASIVQIIEEEQRLPVRRYAGDNRSKTILWQSQPSWTSKGILSLPRPIKPRGQDNPSQYFVEDRSSNPEMIGLMIQDSLTKAGMGGPLSEQPDPASLHRLLDIGCGPAGLLLETLPPSPHTPPTPLHLTCTII